MAKRRRERKKVSAKRRLQEHSSGFESTVVRRPDGMETFKLDKGGIKLLDIIPFIAGKGNPFADEGEEYYERTFWSHRGIGPNNESYICPAKTAQKDCPICEYRQYLSKDPDSDQAEADALKPKERQLWLVQDRKDLGKGVQLWEVSHFLFGKILDSTLESGEEDDGWDYFADPVEGFYLRVNFEEESYDGNKFYKAARIDFKSREPLDENIAEQVPCLDDLLKIEPYEKLKAIFEGGKTKTDDDDVDEDDEPPRRKRRRSTPPPDDVDLDDDDDEDDDEVEEEEEEKPKPKKKPTRTKPVVEEEEEEEEEKPKPRKRRRQPDPEPEDDDEDDDDEPDPDACVACGGSKKNSKGKPCVPCKGTGKKQKTKAAKVVTDDDDLDDDFDEEWDDE